MDRDELHYSDAAQRQGLSLRRHGDDRWSLGPLADLEPLSPTRRVVPIMTFISEGRVRLRDGREFPREMTTAELCEALGIDGPGDERPWHT